jgi:hypothetical protein
MRLRSCGVSRLLVRSALLSVWVCLLLAPGVAVASVAAAGGTTAAKPTTTVSEGSSLEAVAEKASETGRRVAMSLIALAFAIAGVTLAFRRDFREAVGVFAVGLVAVLLVTPAGVNLLRDTVNTLFGGQ